MPATPKCRFCCDERDAIESLAPSTCEAAILFGTGPGAVQRGMRELESMGVLRCATMFCAGCQRVSVIIPGDSDDPLASICWATAWARRFYGVVPPAGARACVEPI